MPFGIKISKEGYDVKTALPDQILFSSDYNVAKVLYAGTIDLVMAANSDIAITSVEIVGDTENLFLGIGFVEIGGKIYRTNFNGSGTTDHFSCYADSFIASNSFVRFEVQRTSSSSTWPGEVTIPIKYFILI